MTWAASAMTPQSPVAFGPGQLELVQIVTPNDSYTDATTGQVVEYPLNNITGLDEDYPYPKAYNTAGGPYYAGGVTPESGYYDTDAPGEALTSGATANNPPTATLASEARMDDSFTDYLMYEPPNSTQFVPLTQMGWYVSSDVTEPQGGWQNYSAPAGQSPNDWAGLVTVSYQFIESNVFPSWTTSDALQNY